MVDLSGRQFDMFVLIGRWKSEIQRPIFFEWSILVGNPWKGNSFDARPISTSAVFDSEFPQLNRRIFILWEIWSAVWSSNFPRLSDPFNYRSRFNASPVIIVTLQPTRHYNFHCTTSNSFANGCIFNDQHSTYCYYKEIETVLENVNKKKFQYKLQM